jgi:mRNA interferase MazF
MTRKRGEVWLVTLDPVVGSELRKTRPAVVISRDEIGALPVRVVVPLTTWQDRFRSAAWLVPIEEEAEKGISRKSAADTVQVRSVSEQRLVKRLGELPQADMQRISAALTIVLQL